MGIVCIYVCMYVWMDGSLEEYASLTFFVSDQPS